MPDNNTPLPEHRIRYSPRARRVSLRVVPGQGLEVVLPLWADQAEVPGILARHSRWIQRALRRMAPQPGQDAQPGQDKQAPPEFLILKGGQERVRLEWARDHTITGERSILRRDSGARQGVRDSGRTLTFLCRQDPETALPREARLALLKDWIRDEAALWLGAMLKEESERLGLPFAGLRVRFQKSRWGSCSSRGGISLNGCLLFLPERLARYILMHELCHTREMNHSEKFWKLVFAADPEALVKDRAMRQAWRHVPAWVLA